MIKQNTIITNEILILGTSVKIIDADIIGKIDAIIQERTGISYRVKWWFGNQKSSCWCHPDEITII